MDSATLSPGTVIADRFRVVRLLGAGGMGAVYEVEHEVTLHRRALKLLHGELAREPEVVSRFLREASAAGRIGSEHIVETFDAGRLPSGEPYLVMELLEGHTLERLLADAGGRLPLTQGLSIVSQAARGIHAAHEAGIVHRDVKPENLFVVRGPIPTVKVLDFGISKFDPALTGTPSLTVDGLAMGTPHYMSPEQVRGQSDIGPATDIYALGVVLYETITGKKPFDAETLPALSIAIHEGEYAPVESLRPGLPMGLGGIVARALARQPTARFRTASEFADAVSDVLAGLGAAAPESHSPTLRVEAAALAHSLLPPPATRPAPTAAGTKDLGHTQLSPGEPRRSSVAWVAVAAAAGVALVVTVALLWARRPAEVTAASAEPSAVPAPQPSALPSVSPVVSARPEPEDAAPSALPPSTKPAPGSGKRSPGGGGTRAKEHGLGTEDPF